MIIAFEGDHKGRPYMRMNDQISEFHGRDDFNTALKIYDKNGNLYASR